MEQYYLAAAWREKLPLMPLPGTMMRAQEARSQPCVQREASPPEPKGPTCLTGLSTACRLSVETLDATLKLLSRLFWLYLDYFPSALASLAAVRAAMSSYSSMPPSSFLSCPLVSRKTLPGANPGASSSDSLLSSASPSDA